MKKLTILTVTLILSVAGFIHAADNEAADKATAYPLTTCIVSGEALDEMGKPFIFEFEGQEVQLCCKDCKKKFDKDPEKYMKKLEAAKAGKSPSTDSETEDHSGHQH